ncbi:MAG: hypothetical protein AAGA96_15370 [Verrucomicrobiota bacterium]
MILDRCNRVIAEFMISKSEDALEHGLSLRDCFDTEPAKGQLHGAAKKDEKQEGWQTLHSMPLSNLAPFCSQYTSHTLTTNRGNEGS